MTIAINVQILYSIGLLLTAHLQLCQCFQRIPITHITSVVKLFKISNKSTNYESILSRNNIDMTNKVKTAGSSTTSLYIAIREDEVMDVDEEILKKFPATKTKPLVDYRQLEYLKQRQVKGYENENITADSLWPGVDFDVPYTLKGCITKFLSHTTPKFIITSTIILAGIRFMMPWNNPVLDILVVVGTMGFWMIQEWFLHKYILHKPLIKDGWLGYHIHKEHHSIPFYHVSLDGPEVAVVWGATICALSFLIFPGELLNICRMDFVLTYYIMGLVYEWTHYLTHTRYMPNTSFVKNLKAHHMIHHLDDNRCKFAFTMPVLDNWFGTSNAAADEGVA